MASHKWDTSRIQTTNITEEASELYNMPAVLDFMEAERCVESLVKFPIEEVGTSPWMEQHRILEKLNLQAHQSAMTNSDEYVLESILTFRKLDVLLNELIVVEAWKENVFPRLLSKLAGRNNMRLYFILYHEATIINLLEILLYHKHVVSTGGDFFVDLIDYLARKLTRLISCGSTFRSLNMKPAADSESAKEMASKLESRTREEELVDHCSEIEFRACVSACALARFMCEHVDALPLSVVSRISDTHDFLVLIIPLIENPPWTRRTERGKWEKLVDHKWIEVPPIDLLKITKLEGQPWLALYHLVAKKEFRDRYHFNSFRKGQLLRVRKYVNEVLLDQLPVLADIQRFMDELAISEVPEPHSAGSVFQFQQVAVSTESIVKGKDWDAVAAHQLEHVFTMTDRDDPDLRKLADLYADDLAQGVLEPVETSDLLNEDGDS